MPTVDVLKSVEGELSTRAMQVCGMFDCPPKEKQELRWQINVPIEDRPWSVGLIVGASGSGKTVCANALFPNEMRVKHQWTAASVIDDFPKSASIESIVQCLSSVGFNTIPAWLRPYQVLSNGEQFRVDMARRMIESSGIIVVDEFTSVVDRQVAQVASHAIQKSIRRQGKQFVAVSCHDDIIEYLQPDWILNPSANTFEWRLLRQRPRINIEIAAMPHSAWKIFAPFHYMSADLHRAAACYGLWANGRLAAFAGVLHRPHSVNKRIKGVSRLVTLPDFQGLGLAFVLAESLGAAYKALGFDFHTYPAHPTFVRAFKSDRWRQMKKAGTRAPTQTGSLPGSWTGQRPCAVMKYIGESMPRNQAEDLISAKGG